MNRSEIIEFWSKNKSRIRTFIRNRVSDDADVDDLLQEVFIKYWIHHVNIKNGEKKILWLFSVARYTIADYYRRRTPDTPVKPIDIPDLESKAVESTSDESKKLLPLIQSLPERYKTVLLKSDIYGESHKEIAQQFNLSVSCVKNRVVRGRRLLAEKMHECCSFSHDTYGNIVHCEEKEAYFDCLEKMKKV